MMDFRKVLLACNKIVLQRLVSGKTADYPYYQNVQKHPRSNSIASIVGDFSKNVPKIRKKCSLFLMLSLFRQRLNHPMVMLTVVGEYVQDLRSTLSFCLVYIHTYLQNFECKCMKKFIRQVQLLSILRMTLGMTGKITR